MRLLVIEDEKRIARAIKSALEQNNFAVDIASDSDSGISAAVDPDYDLIILDRMLPGSFEGVELCRKVRESGMHTPILMLTARGEVDDKVEGLQSGADDYLAKPFSMKELIVRVQVLLRRNPQTAGPIMKLDDLEVNAESFNVKRNGVEIKLSAREFKLLSYLLYNQGQTLSKDKIISHVWDGDSLVVPNTVEVYMGYLRKKIDKTFPQSTTLIHTIHGFGYRISASNV
ncbi:MAG TPA: response regulator transcription factor [Candidatus Saccharimonadales bacterium]|nr:response regulator transcription factor [Candidatus Saccharimonadales bacterium]